MAIKKGYHRTKSGKIAKKGLWYNVNKRKKKGTSRSKAKSTISAKAYRNSQAQFFSELGRWWAKQKGKKMKKKTWKKNTRGIIRNVGLCKYCDQMIISDEAFVIFATKEPAHYSCMKKDDENRSLEQI